LRLFKYNNIISCLFVYFISLAADAAQPGDHSKQCVLKNRAK